MTDAQVWAFFGWGCYAAGLVLGGLTASVGWWSWTAAALGCLSWVGLQVVVWLVIPAKEPT